MKAEAAINSHTQTKCKWGYSSVGRMDALQALGHRFDPDCLQKMYNIKQVLLRLAKQV